MPDDTEIMSQYLQRGATMLGDHCDDCNNPLFRVQGEEMCVVCRTKAGDEASKGSAATGGAGAGDAGDEGAGRDREAAEGPAGPADRGTGDREADPTDALTADEPLDRGAVDEVRRDVLAVARRVARDARDERELARLRDQMAVLESCAEVLDELG